jgi:hypothetical protein
MYEIYYKLDDRAEWQLYGKYTTDYEAFDDAKECLKDGYIIRLEEI